MKLKQLEKLSDLAVGDIVRNKSASEAMVGNGKLRNARHSGSHDGHIESVRMALHAAL